MDDGPIWEKLDRTLFPKSSSLPGQIEISKLDRRRHKIGIEAGILTSQAAFSLITILRVLKESCTNFSCFLGSQISACDITCLPTYIRKQQCINSVPKGGLTKPAPKTSRKTSAGSQGTISPCPPKSLLEFRR